MGNSRKKSGLSHLSLKDRKALKAFKAKLRKALPGRIKGLTLFGSKARGDDHVESDIDVLVLIDVMDRKIKDKIWDLAIDVEEAEEFTLHLSPRVWDEARLKSLLDRERRIALDIVKEGIPF